jgi:hypothetical protein
LGVGVRPVDDMQTDGPLAAVVIGVVLWARQVRRPFDWLPQARASLDVARVMAVGGRQAGEERGLAQVGPEPGPEVIRPTGRVRCPGLLGQMDQERVPPPTNEGQDKSDHYHHREKAQNTP